MEISITHTNFQYRLFKFLKLNIVLKNIKQTGLHKPEPDIETYEPPSPDIFVK